jgi:chromosome partitioning protein
MRVQDRIAALSVYRFLTLACFGAVARARFGASAPRHDSMTLRTIVLANAKGGAGKSTLAAGLAVAAVSYGEKVIALDLDPQGSLANWGEARAATDVAVERVDGERLAQLPQILAALDRRGFTIAILDTPGMDSTGGNLAMRAADLCLVPARPSRLDLQATLPTIQALLRLGLKDCFAFVLNQCPPGRSSRAAEAAAGLAVFGLLAEPTIAQRADHQDALAAGQGVTEFAPEGKAAEEVRALWGWVSRKLNKGKAQHGEAHAAVDDRRPVAPV